MPDDNPVLSALKQALDRDPRNPVLWRHYAELLVGEGRVDNAIEALRSALALDAESTELGLALLPLLRSKGHLSEALIRAESLLERGEEPLVRLEFARILRARGDESEARKELERVLESGSLSAADRATIAAELGADPTPDVGEEDEGPALNAVEVDPGDPDEDWASQFDWGDLCTTFEDVAGLIEVKKQIRLRIIAPLTNPEMFRAFGRKGGGGILLYGPPGCGKTFIAKATAGECRARFVSIGIHEVLDKYWGESEKMIHSLFEEARRKTPTVLFFDEFDALGATRGRTESQFFKSLVDQLLQEMDGIGGNNDQVLVFAATNLPWHVDPAFRRPGRFDRMFFVPPPDLAGRAEILEKRVKKLPGGDGIEVEKLARQTGLMTGADLKALCERASERALERSLESGEVHPVVTDDFQRVLKSMTSSASEWLSTARNYARYSNEGGQYDDLIEFLGRVKRW